MCLDTILNRRLDKKSREGVGYKLFTKRKNWHTDGSIETEAYFFGIMGMHATRGLWLKASDINGTKMIGVSPKYRAGFHIYLKKPTGGPRYTKVRYRGGKIIGRQYGVPCIVATELYIPVKGERIK